ncbi:MAG TPA: class I SAM-dependent methyltransferase [Vicinamibacterales bacterium]|nr:class I SAM-dependent methyltransferase [Vicinamibacterales bacterium]
MADVVKGPDGRQASGDEYAPEDRTAFNDSKAAAAWNEGAEAWDQFVESGSDYYRHEVHGPALLAASEPLPGRKVLDLGCGQGFFSRQLASRGAQVVGIDIAEELLRLARAREAQQALGIDYRTLSASDVARELPRGSFDLVTACMSLQDMADVSGALDGTAAVLRPGGRMVFSVPHPVTDTPFREWERDAAGRKRCLELSGYFDTGQAMFHWNMPRLMYHWSTPYRRYTLSEWSALVTGAGFSIGSLSEPRPTPEQLAANPNLHDCSLMPLFLIFDLQKTASEQHHAAPPPSPRRPGRSSPPQARKV